MMMSSRAAWYSRYSRCCSAARAETGELDTVIATFWPGLNRRARLAVDPETDLLARSTDRDEDGLDARLHASDLAARPLVQLPQALGREDDLQPKRPHR